MLPTPTIALVQAECDEFDREPFTALGEESLAQLLQHFPRNTESSHVLLKALVLNKLYSTRVNDVDVIPFARHIVGLNIDKLIDQGSPSAVSLIFDCPPLRQYFSFATKFCSWHNPTAYPIYDHYVDECLWKYKKQDQFAEFHRQDMGDYEKFVKIVSAFRDHYGLNCFTFRQLDKFLWRTGDHMLGERIDTL